jgi:HK97 family phage major capsid protein/HK97 family phage prohead protease
MTIVRKVTVAKAAGDDDLEFILSDDTKDRYGDVIEPSGWVLANFRKNPIALFNHDSKFPIGKWTDVRVVKDKLVGKLKLAAEGTSERIDEIIRLVEQGILRAVSVGFAPIEREALADNSGILYKKQELLETSLVSVPANPSAIQLARSLVSDATIDLVFGEHASMRGVVTRGGVNGGHASIPPLRKSTTMTPIAERIKAAQESYLAARDELNAHLDGLDDSNVTDEQLSRTKALNETIEAKANVLAVLKDAESNLAATASLPAVISRETATAARTEDPPRPFAVPAKKVAPLEYFWRAATVKVLSHLTKSDPTIVRQRIYGDDIPTKAVTEMITRAASAPATTTTSGWASQLVQTINVDFMDSLMPMSVYPRLSALGLRLGFGRNGTISIPTRSATPTIAGSFVGEGSPIPVRQGAFTAVTLTPKKMAVISTMTREISEHSIPAIEGLISNAIQEDTSVAIDTVLLDATAASAIRPAGLRNGVGATAATAGGGLAALVGDVTGLSAALVSSTSGNLRNPVWIMNPTAANAIGLLQNSLGLFPFRDEMNRGTLNGWPVIVSGTVTAGQVILIDAADFVSVTGDDPRFDVSDQATLHMEDTTPLAIVADASPDVVAAPVRSLWQTDTIGIRMILPMNWAMRRTGVIAWTQSITWD